MDIARYLRQEHGIALSDQQREAMEAVSGDILLLAVPGAGKTTVLAARIANLLANHNADPRRLLTLTFNRESARDMARRWEKLFGGLFPCEPEFSTIHSFCLRLLQEYAAGRGTRVPKLLEGGEERGGKERILREQYRELTGSYLADDALGRLVNAIGYCVNMQLSGEEAARYQQEIPRFPELLARYTAYKRENGLMDFDDMLLFANTVLTRHKDIRERTGERYDYILVDEAQDTSRLQHSILEKLGRGNLFLVGDEDQSIYSFRGAWPQGLIRFFDGHPRGRLLKLEENYRSTAAIVTAADRLIRQNTQRFQKDIFTRRQPGEPVKILWELDYSEEYGAIADLLEKLPEGKTCAVLYRTGYTGIGLGYALRRRGIPFFSKETRLGYQADLITREVGDLFRLARHPGDGELFRRTYFLLPCFIPKRVAEQAVAARSEDILRFVLEEADFTEKNTGRLAWVWQVLSQMRKKPPLWQFDAILEELEYFQFLDHRCQYNYDRNSYLQKLSVLRDFAAAAKDTEEFLAAVRQAEKTLDSPRRCDIVLSTVHSVKGQEFDRVIIADAIEGIFPMADALSNQAAGRPEALEEERRLFYTAMTRAKDRLTIFAPATCLGHHLLPARFLYTVAGAEVPLMGSTPLVPGLRVIHAYFGVGVLEQVDRQGRLTVSFRHYGKKRFTRKELEDGRVFQLY